MNNLFFAKKRREGERTWVPYGRVVVNNLFFAKKKEGW
jgi:hypothetical protein